MRRDQIEEMAKVLDDCPYIAEPIGTDKHDGSIMIAEYLVKQKGYRKQSENTVELPCNVGQKAYVIVGKMLPYIAECEVIAVTHHIISLEDHRKVFTFSVVAKGSKTPENFIEGDIGKRVFFDKEKAEAKMKGGAE